MAEVAKVLRAALRASVLGLAITSAVCASAHARRVRGVHVDDAFARSTARGAVWTIGTDEVALTLDCRGGRFVVSGFRNDAARPAVEYAPDGGRLSPIAAGVDAYNERYTIRPVWQWFLSPGQTHDLGADNLRLPVKAGDMVGFAVGPHGDYTGDQIDWPITVDYGDGTVYRSADEKKVEPGAIWGYYVNAPGSGFMAPMDAVEFSANTGQSIRIPSERSGYRAPGIAPHIGPSVMHPSNEYDAVRVWRAPKAGVVTVRGLAKHIGYGAVDLKVLRIAAKPAGGAASAQPPWRLVHGKARRVVYGGRPAVEVELRLQHAGALVRYHVVAFPRTPILRQWAEVKNAGRGPVSLRPFASAFAMQMAGARPGDFEAHWMVGGNSQRNQGSMLSESIGESYHRELQGVATAAFVPWIGLLRQSGARDGWFMQLDFIGQWRIAMDRERGEPLRVTARLPELLSRSLAPGEQADLPVVTIGTFHGDLDDMARGVYDWQYEYLWDYTHDDWFGLMQFTTAWWADSHNLQEQFAGRLAYLDADWADYIRECGLDVLWDDAGWAASPDIWVGNREGPDFSQTLRYLAKTGMKWTLWFPGDPTLGIMSGKQGAWGDFQWRTDGLSFSYAFDRSFRKEVSTFLRRFPQCSWQTCSGGSTYSHTFDIQRLGDVHYDTDGPGSDITNNNFSYLELPDKCFDNLATWQSGSVKYIPDISRRMLTGAPKWGLYIQPKDMEPLRWITDLYRYLWREGVAGRWSYVAHPVVKDDDADHYLQRLNHARTKSLLILKHRATGEVTIYPRGLLPDVTYRVEYQSGRSGTVATGADLMARGLTIRHQAPGELIYFNLPHRPGSGRDHVTPKAPGRVLSRREVNLGHTGVAIYWSPGADDNWISYYEVRRGDRILGRAATGLFYFDRSEGWDPAAEYAVRTVDGDGNRSPWRPAQRLPDEPLAFSALGAHYAEAERNGWHAESSTDGVHFAPMTWVPPAKPPSADLGGTPNQRGGAEGWWESTDGARVGRGWQLASPKSICVRAWVAPQAGVVRITGRAMKEYYHRDKGGRLQARIMLDDRQLWPQIGWQPLQPGDLTGATQDLLAQVAPGDVLRFELDRGASGADDLLAWMPRTEYVQAKPRGAAGSVVRILCGSRRPYVDREGNAWSADRFFSGGRRVTREEPVANALPTLADQELYRHGRVGRDFTYAIPVRTGLYVVRLKLAELHLQYFFQRPFSVYVNGRLALDNIDICQAARGPRRAYERVLRYVVPDADGRIVLHFVAGHEPTQAVEAAMVQAIEVLPETGACERVVFAPGHDLVDWAGGIWPRYRVPRSFLALMSTKPVTQATPTLYDQQLYQSARTGERLTWSCTIPPGLYDVHLKFAEMWLTEPGKRPMDIWVNGKLFWRNWDPLATAGKPDRAIDLRAGDITPDRNGRITVTIIATGANPAIVQAIEVE